MKKSLIIFITLFVSFSMNAQNTDFDKMLKDLYRYTVPLVKVNKVVEWKKGEEKIYLLDARENKEFNVSHIEDAIVVGYDNFQMKTVNDIPKDAKVVVYCSVGYRSERIGEKLMKAGYKQVYNLYGGIFSWVNEGNEVYDDKGKVAKVHAYNEDWGKWVENDSCMKVY